MSQFIQEIRKNPYYQVFLLDDKPLIIFEDHRFVVPILWLASKTGVVKQGINMFRFDAHFDDLPVDGKIVEEFKKLSTFEECFELAKAKLKKNDDDWLRFGREASLFDASVTVCETTSLDRDAIKTYQLNGLNGSLNYQGELSDHAKSEQLASLWSALGWGLQKPNMQDTPILFDVDCDYFTFKWRGHTNAWLERFYDEEFSENVSTYFSTEGWSNRELIMRLIQRAPFVTMVVEPSFCGGINDARQIVKCLNKKLFNGVIDLGAIECLKEKNAIQH